MIRSIGGHEKISGQQVCSIESGKRLITARHSLYALLLTSTCVGAALAADPVRVTDSDETPKSADVLIEQFSHSLRSLTQLEIQAVQRVTYLNQTFPSELNAGTIERDALKAIGNALARGDQVTTREARIHTNMTPNGFRTEIWQADTDCPGPLMILELSPTGDPGNPLITQDFHYPQLERRRNVTFRLRDHPLQHRWPDLINEPCTIEPTLPIPLFEEVPGGCNAADFWATWLSSPTHDSQMMRIFEKTISEGEVVELDEFDDRLAWRVDRVSYVQNDEDGFQSGHHSYWFCIDSGFLIGRRQQNVHIDIDSTNQIRAGYRVVYTSHRFESDPR